MGFDVNVLLTIAVMHAVAVASPGPDFAVVLKQSLQHGRYAGIVTSIGVGIGILVHVAYSLLGVGIIIASNPDLFNWLLYIAAAYLIWIGVGAIRSAQPTNNEALLNEQRTEDSCELTGEHGQSMINSRNKHIRSSSTWSSFVLGFVTNGLNPKATLFFLALFSVAIPVDTSITVKAFYGVYLAFATACWFCLVTWLVGHDSVRSMYQRKGYVFDRIMGFVIILTAVTLVVSN